ncbi:hypothetical protein BRADI_4g08281v3 [Brachypodium distachyon]|uniref:Uncharacterized protein n=1 Tax=Brachypodium distachyon TaxID=15368 RepID=A0A0Q3HF05_BRADI|nr:hypothetical protein BRADI_4g08281v3 [Brachypodium distachyon]
MSITLTICWLQDNKFRCCCCCCTADWFKYLLAKLMLCFRNNEEVLHAACTCLIISRSLFSIEDKKTMYHVCGLVCGHVYV